MKLSMLLEDITGEMNDWYITRTNNHIAGVKNYANKIAKVFPELKDVQQQSLTHDQSKFKDPEAVPYIHITWQYKMKDAGKNYNPPESIKKQMNEATQHHVKNNRHHPEFHSEESTSSYDRENRDKPSEAIIDSTSMPDIDIAEMCADWCAMSEEKGNTPQTWADKNVNIRWKFNDKQKELIYKILNSIWNIK